MNTEKVYLVNIETGESVLWDEIKEITEDDLESSEEDIQGLVSSKEISEFERQKPNPVYVPKHIARRRKW